jgi:hypothetical protein
MIRLIAMTMLLLVSQGAHLEEDSGEESWRELCRVMAEGAESIMSQRQAGQSMSVLMDRMSGDNMMANFFETLIIDAYDRPRYSTDSMVSRAIEDFKNDAYLLCVRNFRP